MFEENKYLCPNCSEECEEIFDYESGCTFIDCPSCGEQYNASEFRQCEICGDYMHNSEMHEDEDVCIYCKLK